jgi:hypothetical protein
MSERGRPEHGLEDGGFAGVRPACVALVPVTQPTKWTDRAHQPPSRPASTFIAQLLATAEQARGLRGTTVADAQTAYGASQHQTRVAGIRTRQII